MSTEASPAQNAAPFFTSLRQHLRAALAQLQALDAEALARAATFLERSPRKIPMPAFLNGLLAIAPETRLTLQRVARAIGQAAHTTYTKQALHERLSGGLDAFLAHVITTWLGHLAQSLPTRPALAPFARVLVQDSTAQTLPKHLAALFPGAGNQHGSAQATLKIQWIGDLKNSTVEHVSLSAFTHNDQAAAPDILTVARAGDLVMRDLGYFVSEVLARLATAGVFFLSRLRHDVNLYDPRTGQPLDLIARLQQAGSLDQAVWVGPQRVPARLVALPVPQEVANGRRHKAKTSARQRHRSPPGAAHLCLMSWNLFLTNVPAKIWSPKVVVAVYRLRWRIEIIIKTWKSHLGLRQLNCRTEGLLRLSLWTRLLFCALVGHLADAVELHCPAGQHVSLLRLGHRLGQWASGFSATVLGLSVERWIEASLAEEVFYERRRDRKNYYELFLKADPG